MTINRYKETLPLWTLIYELQRTENSGCSQLLLFGLSQTLKNRGYVQYQKPHLLNNICVVNALQSELFPRNLFEVKVHVVVIHIQTRHMGIYMCFITVRQAS